jgi:hypothetical protein
MTLIQTLLSPSRILQVSDRRLTCGDTLSDDSTNKVVAWIGKFFVAFTGPAFMARHEELPTSKWIAATLARNGDADGDVTAVVEMLQASLDFRVGKLPREWDKRMTVTMSGFVNFPDAPADGRTATSFSISNYERCGDDGVVEIHPKPFPNFEFHVARYMGPPSADVAFLYRTNGHYFAAEDMDRINTLGPSLYQNGDWAGMMRLMIEVQRDISERADPKKDGLVSRVGLDALVMSLPKLADDDPWSWTLLTDVSGEPTLANDRPTFIFVPATGFNGELVGPHYAGWGRAISFDGEDLSGYIRTSDPPALG